ncbi:MAG: hypothetical protein ACUVR8_13550 [Acidobacteriota bacterium]
MKACPKCETPWDDAKRFCPYHGLPLAPLPEPMFAPSPVDAEVTVHMSEEERARTFTPQVPILETPSPGRLSASVPPALSENPAPLDRLARSVEDPPTLKSQRQKPLPELDTSIPPTVIVSPSAAPPETTEQNPSLTDTFIPPTVVVSPAEVEAIRKAQEGAGLLVTSRPEAETPSETLKVDAALTSSVDPSATHLLAAKDEPVKSSAPSSPPAMDLGNEIGFILDLEKSSTRLPPPPQVTELPPVGMVETPPVRRHLTPSAVPSLVMPPSPTLKRLTAVQYFKLFNERKKVMQQFVQALDSKRVHITEEHCNQEELLMHRYNLTFRYLASQRTFPLVIILQRKPVYDLITSVDLYEVGESPRVREERTKALGGKCKPTPNGVLYYLSYAEDLPTEQFSDWLRATFQGIAQLLPGLSFP